jgi:hypothetical protein
MTDTRVTSIIETHHEKPYVPSTKFGRAMLGANGVANKLLFHRISVQQPRRRRPVLERCEANSKQYGVQSPPATGKMLPHILHSDQSLRRRRRRFNQTQSDITTKE